MWYTRVAYRPITHKLLTHRQKAVPFADINNEDETTPDELETPGDVSTPTPEIPEVIPDLTTEIGAAPVDAPEPVPQSINPTAPSPENPKAPHDGCHCDRRLREIPTDKPYKRIFWDADGACPICQNSARDFNARQEQFFNSLNALPPNNLTV